ncbi:MAG TPA: molybdopterin-dependent oxidoreductase, partial [Actinomycetota bacterium]|nr:molybdopterin-dependent oxidoreductase [Actinomycetota bacterium]
RGALRAGLHPELLPGGRRVSEDRERAVVEVAWGTLLPTAPGRDAGGILEAAARRELDVLFLVGVDPLRDYPDAALARRALENVPRKVVVDISAEAMAIYADAMLPAAPFLEKDGHYTDWEGRAQRLRPVREPLGLARSEWEIFQELSELMGRDLGFRSLDDLREEMAQLVRPPAEVGVASAPSPAHPPRRLGDASPPAAGDAGAVAGGLVLFSYPLLVDEGALSVGADRLKEALEEPAFVELHPEDAAALGVAAGARARLRTEAGEATLPVRLSEGLARGTAFVPWNQPGFAANALLRGRLHAPVAVEPAEAEVRTR